MEGQPLVFCLVLESELRGLLRREMLKTKRKRKLSATEQKLLDEKLLLCRFDPDRIQRQAFQAAYDALEQRQKAEDEKRAQEIRDSLTAVVEAKVESHIEAEAEKLGNALSQSVAEKVVNPTE